MNSKSIETSTKSVSLLLVLFSWGLVVAAFSQITFMRIYSQTTTDTAVMAIAAIVLLGGLLRSRAWVEAPQSQASGVLTTETFLLAATSVYFYMNEVSLAALASLCALGFQIVFRDYCGGLVRRQLEDRNQQFRTELLDVLKDNQVQVVNAFQSLVPELKNSALNESSKLAHEMREAVDLWKTALQSSAQAFSSHIDNVGQSLGGLLTETVQTTMTTIQNPLKNATEVLSNRLTEASELAIRTWLQGAQKASENWNRASETGVRCLNDQLQIVARQWDEQLTLSRAWLEELQRLLEQIRTIGISWDELSGDQLNRQQQVVLAAQGLSQQLTNFQGELDRVLTQLSHEQKEWTLNLLNQKRYLQIDQ